MNPSEVIDATLAAPAHGFSLMALFWQAHIVVKLVMIGLVLASVWCWAIILDKVMLFRKNKRTMDKFERVFWSGQSLDDLYKATMAKPGSPLGVLFVSAMREWRRSHERGAKSPIGLQTRIEKVMDVSMSREAEKMEKGLVFLASTGSAAPFVGLFGTVWGIMTAFQAIAVSENTSLAVVAPGIAEALLATAIGLIAAIPAVIAYNRFSTTMNSQVTRMEGFADEFSSILSRQIDERSRGSQAAE